MELISSATNILAEKVDHPRDLSNAVEEACKVASCGFEHNTSWGKQVRYVMCSSPRKLKIIKTKVWLIYDIVSVAMPIIVFTYFASLASGRLDLWVDNRRPSNRDEDPCKGMEIHLMHAWSTRLCWVCTNKCASYANPEEEVDHRTPRSFVQQKQSDLFHPQCQARV